MHRGVDWLAWTRSAPPEAVMRDAFAGVAVFEQIRVVFPQLMARDVRHKRNFERMNSEQRESATMSDVRGECSRRIHC